MEFLLDANIAYTMLVTGILLGLLALVNPGTGALEVGALFAFTVAAYGAYNLNINPWAFVVLALALIPFLYSLRVTKWRAALLGATILLVIGGSVFMFVGENSWPAVNPVVATVVSLMYGGFLYFGIDRSIAAMQARPSHDPDRLIGQIGEAKTRIHESGSAQVAGELWSVRSERVIAAGSAIRVVKREGLTLLVEKHP